MVPTAYVPLDALPRTPNGKVDDKSLPFPEPRPSTGEYVAPTTSVEHTLVSVWQEFFRTKQIGAEDNFFDLGGHSLLAVAMFARMEEVTGRRVPIATLFRAPTIRGLAARMESDVPQDRSLLIPVQPGGTRTPFFCVEPGGIYNLYYRDLASHLGPEQPLYSFESEWFDVDKKDLGSVPEVASKYLREVRRIQPRGPYLLGGLCLGGVIAFEMAHQLLDQGEEVAHLALLDTYAPEYRRVLKRAPRRRIVWERLTGRLHLELENLRLLPMREKLSYLRQKFGRLSMYMKAAFARRRSAARTMVAASDLDSVGPIAYLYDTYEPKPLAKSTLYRATWQPGGADYDPTLGWRDLVKELEIVDVSGHHSTIAVEPKVAELAEKLSEHFKLAQPNVAVAPAERAVEAPRSNLRERALSS
jgi:thioesterase domain-containing protein